MSLLLVAVASTFGASHPEGRSGPALEYEVKAAFLYNFAKFVEWPRHGFAAESRRLSLCILGEDPFSGVLDQTLAGKVVNNRKLIIRYFEDIGQLEPCHILFVAPTAAHLHRGILERLGGHPVLTVGDTEGLAERGIIINLTLDGGRVRFEINPDAAARARLRLSSKLLNLAAIVRDAAPAGE